MKIKGVQNEMLKKKYIHERKTNRDENKYYSGKANINVHDKICSNYRIEPPNNTVNITHKWAMLDEY